MVLPTLRVAYAIDSKHGAALASKDAPLLCTCLLGDDDSTGRGMFDNPRYNARAGERLGTMMAQRLFHAARAAAILVAAGLLFLLGLPNAAFADCNEDIAKLTQKRQAVIDKLNELAKGSKNELDPITSCPRLRALVAAEKDLISYLKKNKDWCNIPDDAIANISDSSSKSSNIANQACKVAAQMKKAQEQQAIDALHSAPRPKLPAGPL